MEQPIVPKFTAAGSFIPIGWHYGFDRNGESYWETPAPTLATLRWLREPDFVWGEDAVLTFFAALYRDSSERRIAEGHNGLLQSAATTLAKAAIDAYCNACRKVRVRVVRPLEHMPDMIEPIIDEMLNASRLKDYSDIAFRLLAMTTLSDPEWTVNHPYIKIPKPDYKTPEHAYDLALVDHQQKLRLSPKYEFNQALDVIALYSEPEERVKYRPLETLLTAALRVIYVIEHRAY